MLEFKDSAISRFECDLEVKEIKEDDDAFIVKGYGSTFGNMDLGRDVMERGAFAKTIGTRNVKFLFGHRMHAIPLGKVDILKEDRKGLYFEASMPKADTEVAGRIIPQLKHGSISGTSIGYRTIKDCFDHKKRVRRLQEVDLFEISLVNMPMNPRAGVTGVKEAAQFAAMSAEEQKMFFVDTGCDPDLAEKMVRAMANVLSEQKDRGNSEDYQEVKDGLSDILTKLENMKG